MIKPILQDAYTPLKITDLQMFELEYGLKLPLDYREFLLRQNGGSFRRLVILRRSGANIHSMRPLFRVDRDVSVEDGYEDFLLYVSRDFLPIGDSTNGDIYCVKLTPDDGYGAVWYWDHEVGGMEGLELESSSFTEFFDDMIYDPEIDWRETDPPFVACERGDVESLGGLLDHGLSVNLCKPNGETLLMNAAGAPQPKIVELLVTRGAKTEAQDATGRRALHYAARVGALDCARAIVSAGANVNVQDELGWTPLLDCIRYGDSRLAIYLIECGADINADAGDGITPLSLCLQSNQYMLQPVLERLRKADAQ